MGSEGDQLIAVVTQLDLLGMLDLSPPGGVGEVGSQVVQLGAVCLCQLGIGHHGLGIDSVSTGQIQRHGVEGSEHAHIGDDGHIVLLMAVTVGAYVPNQADVEMRTAIHNGLGVLGDLVV